MGVVKVTLNNNTLMDITDTTAVAADVAQTKYFYNVQGNKTAGTASGGGGDESFKKLIDKSITSAEVPSGLTTIGEYAFYHCYSLSNITLPSGITTIGNYAFSACPITSMSIPSSVTSIGTGVFYGCTNLTTVNIPTLITSLPNYCFYNCSSLEMSTLPSNITAINTSAFQGCSSITSLSSTAEIRTLGNNAFTGTSGHSSNLVSVMFPDLYLTSNLGSVFGNSTASNACQKLEIADLGIIAGIESYAFTNCIALTTIILRKTASITTLASTTPFNNTKFTGYGGTGTVYVPNSLIASYQTANNWKTLYNNGTVTFSAIEGSQYEITT